MTLSGGDPLGALEGCLDLVRLVRVGDHDHGLTGHGVVVLVEHLQADDGLRFADERLLIGKSVRVELEYPERERTQDDCRRHPDRARPGSDGVPDARPQTRFGVIGGAVPRPQRPEDPSSGDDEQRRQQAQHGQQADGDADGKGRSHAGCRVHLSQQQAEHAHDHRGSAGEDGRACAVQGDGHGLVTVLVAAQLLAVPGNQQQRVVGPGAEHEHGEDALGLPVDREDAVLGQQVDDSLRGGERDARGDHRQQPEDRAPICEQQNDDDDRERGVQQRAVDALERLGEVRADADRTRDIHRQAGIPRRRLAVHALHEGRQLVPPVLSEIDRDDHLQRLSVIGGDRPDHITLDEVEAGERLRVLGSDGLVGLGDAAGALVDDDRRRLVRVTEGRRTVVDLRRLGTARKPVDGVVVLNAGELPRERACHRHDGDPKHKHDPLRDPPGG